MSIRRVVHSQDFSPQTVASIGIAVYGDLSHVGVLYRITEHESVEILHLAWHRNLRSEVPSGECVYWVRPNIPPDRAEAIATMCRRIWTNAGRGKVTFSFGRPSGYFDAFGRQVRGPAKAGLTCAAFVLAVFDAAKYPLVLEEQWPPPTSEDVARQEELLKLLKQTRTATQEDIEACAAEVGNVRFRPLEVAGAGTADDFPTTYEFARGMAIEIESMLNLPEAGRR